MTATAHALVGGAIAASVPDPAIGLPLATLSHPILDLIPHWDFGWGWRKKTKTRLFLQSCFDMILGIALTFLFFGSSVNQIYLLLAIFFSLIWDFMEAPYWFFGWKFPFYYFYQIQHRLQGKAKGVISGILTQVGTVAVVVLVLGYFT